MGSAAKNLLREALLWGAVALGGLALIYFFNDLRAALGPGGADGTVSAGRDELVQAARSGFAGEVRLKADAQGHFVFSAAVNDRPARFMADTGAIALSTNLLGMSFLGRLRSFQSRDGELILSQ